MQSEGGPRRRQRIEATTGEEIEGAEGGRVGVVDADVDVAVFVLVGEWCHITTRDIDCVTSSCAISS